MPQKIRMWEVTDEQTLTEIPSDKISLEEQLEDWLESDISMLDENLLVIGRQVSTDFGGQIDLLCLDSSGETVVVELKKGKTPRQVTAQALEYASWVKELSPEQVIALANSYDKIGGSLKESFEEKFGDPLPETINLRHRSLVVAESMDDSTERIVRYLSDLNVPINIATVQHFKTADDREMLAQIFLVEPEVAEVKAIGNSRGRTRKSLQFLESLAEKNGIGKLYRELANGVSETFKARGTSSTLSNYVRYQAQLSNGSTRAVMYAYSDTDEDNPGMYFEIQATWLSSHLGVDIGTLKGWLPDDVEELDASNWVGSSVAEREGAIGLGGYFHTKDEVDKFITGLRASVE
ncbi:MAG: endonuclease NucS [Chloroflexi bacterium]|nr:endonuclease NucS [Chloroflexota bacterium]